MTGLGRRRICTCTYMQISESRLPELLQHELRKYHKANRKIFLVSMK